MTHDELSARMSGKEFVYWAALYRIEAAETQKAQRDARGKAKARQMVSRMQQGGGV